MLMLSAITQAQTGWKSELCVQSHVTSCSCDAAASIAVQHLEILVQHLEILVQHFEILFVKLEVPAIF